MKEPDKSVSIKIEALIKNAMDNFNPQNIEVAINYLKEAWELIPLPKHEYNDSFLVSKYIAHVYFNARRFSEAETWAKEFLLSDNFHRNYGESEFQLAKTYHELDQLEGALKYFIIASEKSFDGKLSRVWTGEKDRKYLIFYKTNKPKELTQKAKIENFKNKSRMP